MAYANDSIEIIRQHLKDAGLSDDKIADCTGMIENGDNELLERFLGEYRTKQLNKLHMYSDRIYCIDHLIYTLKRSGGNQC